MNETGYITPKGRYVPPVLFSPYTGEPRDARDIASDPHGALIVPPGAALAAAPLAPAAPSPWFGPVRELMGHLSDVLDDEAFGKIDTTRWNAVSALIGTTQAAPAAPAVDADPLAEFLRDTGPAIVWPKARDVGRIGDMSPSAHLRVGLDSDNDVYASIYDEHGGGSIEFCTPGQGGGKSSRTRMALLAVMVAMEADNAADPGRDWWALRNGAAQAKEGGAQ